MCGEIKVRSIDAHLESPSGRYFFNMVLKLNNSYALQMTADNCHSVLAPNLHRVSFPTCFLSMMFAHSLTLDDLGTSYFLS